MSAGSQVPELANAQVKHFVISKVPIPVLVGGSSVAAQKRAAKQEVFYFLITSNAFASRQGMEKMCAAHTWRSNDSTPWIHPRQVA